tara:strand:+ start:154910 stop:155260 length:351 start_codon:yes stop_codon:yes gene_type:complete
MLNMKNRTTAFPTCVALSTAALFCSPAPAAETQNRNTVMTVGEMCGGCVKKITTRFDDVKGIAKLECSIEKKSVTLVPEKGVRLSPKAIWVIMESIGKTPNKMVTPDGTFTSKPKK